MAKPVFSLHRSSLLLIFAILTSWETDKVFMQEVKHIWPYLHLWDQSFLLHMDGQDYHHGFFFKAYHNSRTESATRVYFIDIAVLS